MRENMKLEPMSEIYVQSEQGLRIEGREEIVYNGEKRIYRWMRYTPIKNMDDLKR